MLLVTVAISVGAVVAETSENKGAEHMVLSGGSRGEVPFPHAAHQSSLKDCELCHSLFPQQPGAIEELKKQGTLKKKLVMKNCTVCHRKTEKSGRNSGPTRCKTCHQR